MKFVFLEPNKKLRQDLYETFNSFKMIRWLQTFNPNSNEVGDVQLVKNTQKATKWDNFMQFLKHTFY